MQSINFNIFVDQVESGKKRQTIRKSTDAKVGDTLHLYSDMDTDNRRILLVATCTSVEDIIIDKDIHPFQFDRFNVTLANKKLDHNQIIQLVGADGFKDPHDFERFFINHPKADHINKVFKGVLIKWHQSLP